MTRHEKLQKAADRWADSAAFICGAYWADDNPKSPWISVDDDLPCNHEELIDKEINMMACFLLKIVGNGHAKFILKLLIGCPYLIYQKNRKL